jgi:hypothetical protein
MHTTNQILDALALKLGGGEMVSDYRLSKVLHASGPATVGHWRKGRSSLNPTYAVKVAQLLAWEPAYVIACVEHERAEKDARLENTGEVLAVWDRIAQQFKPAAAVVLLAFLAAGATSKTLAGTVDPSTDFGDQSIHYANRRRRDGRRRSRLLALIFPAWDPGLMEPLQLSPA